jgi:hypothetical protein
MKLAVLDRSSRPVFQLLAESAGGARALATAALGVLEGKRLVLGLILQSQNGVVRELATFDSLALAAPLTLSSDSFENLWCALAPLKPTAALLCDRATFEGLAQAEKKLSYLAAVGHAHPYFYRVEA